MRKLILIVVLLSAIRLSQAAETDDPIDGGLSPDHKVLVTNIHDGEGGYFVIRDKTGNTLFSEKSFGDEYEGVARFAWSVLWRADSHYVAISFGTTKFAVETVVFYREGNSLTRIKIPAYDPFDWEDASYGSSDNTHRVAHHWRKNGDLVMDITTGYHTKSEPGITGYYATIHFKGNPPIAFKRSSTQSTSRD